MPRPVPGAARVALLVLAGALCINSAASASQVPAPARDEPPAIRDAFRVAIPPRADAGPIGNAIPATPEPPATLTPDERRQRARRLSRSPLARQRVVNADGSISFVLRNQLHAPVTVLFEPVDATDAVVDMLVARRITLPALASLDVARIRGLDPLVRGEANFVYTAVIGEPSARHDDRVEYAWPFPPGASATVSQGPGGPTHRERAARHAVDFAVVEGTPVLAARAGVVVFLEERYFESGLDYARFLARSNQVRVLHDDGSMGTYGHLFPQSITVEPGQRVAVGDRLGLSGNTGYSSGPHLHFAVLLHRDMGMVSIPFRMARLTPPPLLRDTTR
jgi:murein DD-endopeptidase MepM/ murein hydrolase activator NlpD